MSETDDRKPVPRDWREEFDGLKPIKPTAYRKSPAQGKEQPPFPKCWDESPERSKHARKAALALKEARRLGQKG